MKESDIFGIIEGKERTALELLPKGKPQ